MKSIAITICLVFSIDIYAQYITVPDSTGNRKPLFINPYAAQLRQFVAPCVFLAYGAFQPMVRSISNLDKTTNAELREDLSHFGTNTDNYLQYVPLLSLFALDAFHLTGVHTIWQRAGLTITSGAMLLVAVYALKSFSVRMRPDGSTTNSFPSGHTASAFMGAEMLHIELKDKYPLLSFAGYLPATATGALRMCNNRHWLSDVIAGAGLGILSAKAGYWLFYKVRYKHQTRHLLTYQPY